MVAALLAGAVVPVSAHGQAPVGGARPSTGLQTLTGVITEVHGSPAPPGSKVPGEDAKFFLESGHKRYQLKVHGDSDLASRTTGRVTGVVAGKTIDTTVTGGAIVQATPLAATPALGTKTVLVINLSWPGSTLTATKAQQTNFLFGADSRSLASFYRDVSYGQMTWTGTETPTYVGTNPGTCDLYNLSDQGEAAATAGGYSPASYDALIVNVPNLNCTSLGYGEIGGKHTWIQDGLWNLDDGYQRLVPAHEIGHALGLYHSHGLECGSTTISLSCLSSISGSSNEEYGNAYDVMGNNWPGDSNDAVTWFSAKQELNLGWISGSGVQSVTTSGTYTLLPLEQSGAAAAQVLVLHTPSYTYYVEYRQAIGQDSFLADYPAATNGVQISVAASDPGPSALDFTPDSVASTVGGYNDWFDANLANGKSFTDPSGVFTLTAVSNGVISVRFGGTRSVPALPADVAGSAISPTTATLSWLPPASDGGSAVTGYRVSRDGGAGWSRTLPATARSQSFTLSAGQTYRLSVAAVNAIGAGPVATVPVTMPAASPLTAPQSFKIVAQRATKSATMSWKPPAGNGGSPITGYAVARTGTPAWSKVLPATARSQKLTLSLGVSYTLSVRAITAAATGPAASGSIRL
jgi:hypothetical protein